MLRDLLGGSGWDKIYFGNSLEQISSALVVLLILLFAFKVFEQIILWRLRSLADRTKTDVDNTLVKIIESIRPPFYLVIALYFAFTFLETSNLARSAFASLVIALIAYESIKALQTVVDYLFDRQLHKKEHKSSEPAFRSLASMIKIALWVLGGLVVLQNLGVNVTSLIAGLGIGGIAIALAAQNVLADLFSSFAILFDKPFIPGDYIVIGDKSGTVEKTGIKTTRIRALGGEELVISNQELTSSKIQNFGKLKKRRVQFQLGVTYDTPEAKLKKIPKAIEKIVGEYKKLEFDRTHLKEFGDSAIVYEVVFLVLSDNYNVYMDARQSVNLKIIKAFEKEGIEFAYPTQTLYLKK